MRTLWKICPTCTLPPLAFLTPVNAMRSHACPYSDLGSQCCSSARPPIFIYSYPFMSSSFFWELIFLVFFWELVSLNCERILSCEFVLVALHFLSIDTALFGSTTAANTMGKRDTELRSKSRPFAVVSAAFLLPAQVLVQVQKSFRPIWHGWQEKKTYYGLESKLV